MGTEISRRGVSTTLLLWSAEALLTHPEVVQKIHEDSIAAGAEIVITDTFRTTERAFAKKNLADEACAATVLACQLVRQAIVYITKFGVAPPHLLSVVNGRFPSRTI